MFDLDGTLTDSREGIVRSIQHALATLGRPSSDPVDLVQFIGPPLIHSFRALLNTSDESLVRSALAAYRTRFISIGIFENHLYPNIPETLQRAGHRLHVVTSKPAVFARTIVEYFNLGSYFSSIHGPELEDAAPDKESLIRRAVTTEGMDSNDVLMIGDREHDIIGARRNGIASVAVTWGYGSLRELTAAAPDHIVSSAAALVDLLRAA